MNKKFCIIFAPYFAYTLISLQFGKLFLIFNLLVFLYQTVKTLYATYKITKVLKHDNIVHVVARTHVFVIPNNNVSIQQLNNTLTFLACHSCSHKYVIILAMEEMETGSVDKAIILVNQYNNTFMRIVYTIHTPHLNEIPELIANANSAIRTMAIDLNDDDIVTIMRHDVLIPERYVLEMDILANNDDIFAPPILYDQNTWYTPIYVCIHDFLTATSRIPIMMHSKGFPMHVYSMSMALIKKTGYWDIGRDSVAHGIHMVLKSSIASNVSTVMIPVPVNMKHDKDGCDKYTESVKSFFGLLDIVYTYHHVFNTSSVMRSISIVLQLYEVYVFPVVNLQTLSLFLFRPTLYIFHIVTFVLLLIKITCYEIIRHSSCNTLFKRDPLFLVFNTINYIYLSGAVCVIYNVIPFFHVMILILQNKDSIQILDDI